MLQADSNAIEVTNDEGLSPLIPLKCIPTPGTVRFVSAIAFKLEKSQHLTQSAHPQHLLEVEGLRQDRLSAIAVAQKLAEQLKLVVSSSSSIVSGSLPRPPGLLCPEPAETTSTNTWVSIWAHTWAHTTVAAEAPGWLFLQVQDAGLAYWLDWITAQDWEIPSATSFPSIPANLELLWKIQVTHARCCSLLNLAEREKILGLSKPTPANHQKGWRITHPLLWLQDDSTLLTIHPMEWQLLTQLIISVEYVCNPDNFTYEEKILKQISALCRIFWQFNAICFIFGAVSQKQPKLAQARLGLVLATQIVLNRVLVDRWHLPAPSEL